MPKSSKSQDCLRVLHVLTLNTNDGRYGGPASVALELCQQLGQSGVLARVFSGTIRNHEPEKSSNVECSFVHVKPSVKAFPVSSLWSWRLIPALNSRIKNVQLVHIHFARDLVSICAALIAIARKKCFIVQTHGMVVPDKRLIVKVIDRLLIKRVLGKSSQALMLSPNEKQEFEKLNIDVDYKIFPNAVSIKRTQGNRKREKKVLFCGRLHEQKRVSYFVDVAEILRNSSWQFEIVGPDGGALDALIQQIALLNLGEKVKYMGHLTREEVQEKIRRSSLVVLPSFKDQFPMVILESLSLGTPVVVTPSCGLSDTLRSFNKYFVAETESVFDIAKRVEYWMKRSLSPEDHEKLIDFCRSQFSIVELTNALITIYQQQVPIER